MTTRELKHILAGECGIQLCDIIGLFGERYQLAGNAIYDDTELPPEATTDLEMIRSGYPVPYLIGQIQFGGRYFKINEDVLIPRPETEELIWRIIEIEKRDQQPKNVLDLCTGSGVIGISLYKELISGTKITATDISENALKVARENARINEADIIFRQADFLRELKTGYRFDIIVCNPPYVSPAENNDPSLSYEPAGALFAGVDGLDFFRRFVAEEQGRFLKPDSRLYFEASPLTAKPAAELLQNAYPQNDFQVLKDMSGKERFIFGFPRL